MAHKYENLCMERKYVSKESKNIQCVEWNRLNVVVSVPVLQLLHYDVGFHQ